MANPGFVNPRDPKPGVAPIRNPGHPDPDPQNLLRSPPFAGRSSVSTKRAELIGGTVYYSKTMEKLYYTEGCIIARCSYLFSCGVRVCLRASRLHTKVSDRRVRCSELKGSVGFAVLASECRSQALGVPLLQCLLLIKGPCRLGLIANV